MMLSSCDSIDSATEQVRVELEPTDAMSMAGNV